MSWELWWLHPRPEAERDKSMQMMKDALIEMSRNYNSKDARLEAVEKYCKIKVEDSK